nr:hypothetical protein [Tanacetum cinerariifolium]
EDLFTSSIEHGILQDSSEPSNDNINIANALREPFVGNQDPGKNSSQSPPQINHHCCYSCGDPLEGIFCHKCTWELCGNGAHYGYNCPSKVPIIPNSESFNNQTIKELPPTMQNFDPKADLVHDSPKVFDPPSQLPFIPCEFCGNDARLLMKPINVNQRMKTINEEAKQIKEDQAANARYWKIHACYDDDDDYNFAITPNEPDNSLSIGDEHLDTIPATESDEFIKSRILNIKMMGDVSDQKVLIPGLTITLVSNQEKSPDLLSHRGFEIFQPSAECPMKIHGKKIPTLDVPIFHFYPPRSTQVWGKLGQAQ